MVPISLTGKKSWKINKILKSCPYVKVVIRSNEIKRSLVTPFHEVLKIYLMWPLRLYYVSVHRSDIRSDFKPKNI